MNAPHPDAGRLRSWRATGDGLILELDHGTAELSIAQDGTVRLRAAAGDALPAPLDPALGFAPWRPADTEVRRSNSGRVTLTAAGSESALRVEIEPDPLLLRVRDGAGDELARLEGLGFDPGGGARIVAAAAPDERFFGFGEKWGPLDQRGARLRMRNQDPEIRGTGSDPLYVSIPFFMGVRREGGCFRTTGLFLCAAAPSRFDVAASDPEQVWMETDAGGLDISVVPGPRPADVLRRFTARVGRTPLPPRWALGHHQSRWSYASAKQVRAVARELRRRRLPTDVIHLDIDYMDGYRVFTWHPRRFPEPKALLDELAAEGFRVVTIIDPGVKQDPDYAVFREGEEQGFFCRQQDGSPYTLRCWPKQAALPDFNREEVRRWWGGLHAPLLEAGVAGIWNDMNEPAGWQQDVRAGRLIVPWRKQDLSRVVQADPARPEQSVPHEQVRNLYGQQECRATRSFLESQRPEERAFLLTRSGFAGIQRHAAVWTGDNWSRWEHLRASIPTLLNLSLSGVAFCGADIGGFAFSCTPELYARWLQIGALQPFARTHSMWGTRRQEPWRFGARVETVARAALELRMRLLPYLEGLFREAEQSGAPVWRPLFWEFPDDAEGYAVADQLMLGPSLLVAPVLTRGAVERPVYLPPGVWYGWEDDARYLGGRRVRVPAPLERLPLFARGGSVIPIEGVRQHAAQLPAGPPELHVFPGASDEPDGDTAWTRDDGHSTAYRGGAVARQGLHLRQAADRLELALDPREGSFVPPPGELQIVFHAVPAPRSVRLDGRALPAGHELPGYHAAEGRVVVRLRDDGEARTVVLEAGG